MMHFIFTILTPPPKKKKKKKNLNTALACLRDSHHL